MATQTEISLYKYSMYWLPKLVTKSCQWAWYCGIEHLRSCMSRASSVDRHPAVCAGHSLQASKPCRICSNYPRPSVQSRFPWSQGGRFATLPWLPIDAFPFVVAVRVPSTKRILKQVVVGVASIKHLLLIDLLCHRPDRLYTHMNILYCQSFKTKQLLGIIFAV